MAKKEPIVKGQKEISIRANGTKRVRTINTLLSKTQKQWKDDVDVNKIMARYKKTGQINHLRNAAEGVYADLTELPDLLTAKLQIQQAELTFAQIPASTRAIFNNDPLQLISYLKDPKNHEEAIKLGLMVKRDEPNSKPNDATTPPTPPTPPTPEASSLPKS